MTPTLDDLMVDWDLACEGGSWVMAVRDFALIGVYHASSTSKVMYGSGPHRPLIDRVWPWTAWSRRNISTYSANYLMSWPQYR